MRRCSHLGGHRFAPTAVTMPENRWWAYLDIDVLDRIIAGGRDVELLQHHYRGTGLLDARAQVVERYLAGTYPDDITASVVQTDAVEDAESRSVRIGLEWLTGSGRHRAVAIVTTGPPSPVPQCGSQVLEVTKSEASFQLSAVSVD